LVLALMGTLWALQGAYLIPATFMRGYEWIGIGAAVAALGVALILVSFIRKRPPDATTARHSVEQVGRVREHEVGAEVRPAEPE
jgi:hypothetical protein